MHIVINIPEEQIKKSLEESKYIHEDEGEKGFVNIAMLYTNAQLEFVDVERKTDFYSCKYKILPKGHWIHRTEDGGCFWEECSVCHTERAFSTKYCPDCGTYMYADIRTDAPTVIEADKAESEE